MSHHKKEKFILNIRVLIIKPEIQKDKQNKGEKQKIMDASIKTNTKNNYKAITSLT